MTILFKKKQKKKKVLVPIKTFTIYSTIIIYDNAGQLSAYLTSLCTVGVPQNMSLIQQGEKDKLHYQGHR